MLQLSILTVLFLNIANIYNVFKFTIQTYMRMSILEWEAGSVREHCGALGLKFIDPISSVTDENSEGWHCLPKVTFANGIF